MWPVTVSLILLLVALFALSPSGSYGHATLNLWLISIPIPLNYFLLKSLLIAAAFIAFAYPAFRNYTSWFQTEFDIRVAYDEAGVKRALTEFTDLEKLELNIKADWKDDLQTFKDWLDDELEHKLKLSYRFASGGGRVSSVGHATFEVRRVHGWSTQTYTVVNSHGWLYHELTSKTGEIKHFESNFRLQDPAVPATNMIRLSLADIYLRFTTMLRPSYRQIYKQVGGVGEEYVLSAVAITKVRFFPVAKIGTTVYLWRPTEAPNAFPGRTSHDELIPFAYAVYSPRGSTKMPM